MCKTHLLTAFRFKNTLQFCFVHSNVVRQVKQRTLKHILKDCKALQCPVLMESVFLTKPPHFYEVPIKKEHKRTVNPLAGILCCYTVPLVLCGGLLLYFVHLLKSDLYIIFPGCRKFKGFAWNFCQCDMPSGIPLTCWNLLLFTITMTVVDMPF